MLLSRKERVTLSTMTSYLISKLSSYCAWHIMRNTLFTCTTSTEVFPALDLGSIEVPPLMSIATSEILPYHEN